MPGNLKDCLFSRKLNIFVNIGISKFIKKRHEELILIKKIKFQQTSSGYTKNNSLRIGALKLELGS